MTRVLSIEDDRELAATVRGGLEERGFDVVRAATFRAGLATATFDALDVIVLDVMLPGGSGFDVGGDDYLNEPFVFPELVARLRALARRRTRCPRPFASLTSTSTSGRAV